MISIFIFGYDVEHQNKVTSLNERNSKRYLEKYKR